MNLNFLDWKWKFKDPKSKCISLNCIVSYNIKQLFYIFEYISIITSYDIKRIINIWKMWNAIFKQYKTKGNSLGNVLRRIISHCLLRNEYA